MSSVTRRTTIASALALSATGCATSSGIAAEKITEPSPKRVPSASFDADALSIENADVDGFSMPFLDNNTMMALIYDIPIGADAPQDPHGLDEIYVVLKGRSQFMVAGNQHTVQPGSILFVRAGDEHYFKDIIEDLQVVIVFSKADKKLPPYYER